MQCGGGGPRARGIALAARAVLAAIAATAAVASGCRAGGKMSLSEVNDDLRRRVIEQEKQIASLEGERAELKVKLAEAEHARAAHLPRDVLDALPRCTRIEIGTLSGLQPADAASPAHAAVVYIVPRDGRLRFVQIVGTLKLVALVLPASLDRPAPAPGGDGQEGGAPNGQVLTIAERTVGPVELRDAYRSGIAGTHYMVEMPLSEPVADRGARILFRAEFLDALTGQVHKAEWIRAAK